MNKTKILIIETGEPPKPNRLFTGGDDEWKDGWRFTNNKDIALKIEDSEAIDYPDNFVAIPCDKNCIIWLKWQADKTKTIGNITKLTKSCMYAEIYLTSHELELLLIGDIKNNLKIKRPPLPYSLGDGQAYKFSNILKQNEKGKYLDAMAPFEDIFNCFFLYPPDVLAIVIHKVNGILSTLDLDLQTLLDCDFRDDMWVEITNSYKNQKKVEEVKKWINGDEISLKRLEDQEKSRNKIIEEKFKEISSLFEDDKLKPLKEILSGFKAKQIDKVRKNIEGFRDWFKKLLMAFENFIEVVKVTNKK